MSLKSQGLVFINATVSTTWLCLYKLYSVSEICSVLNAQSWKHITHAEMENDLNSRRKKQAVGCYLVIIAKMMCV